MYIDLISTNTKKKFTDVEFIYIIFFLLDIQLLFAFKKNGFVIYF